jgi:NAD(P)-dependent dehydrogenase (short-subunit alcohol dehydrogenase family)
MSSISDTLFIPTISSFTVSKCGINQLTGGMALSLAGKGMCVNATVPGTIAAELAVKAFFTREEVKARIHS